MHHLFQLFAQAEPAPVIGLIDKVARARLSYVLYGVTILTVLRLALYPYLLKTPVHLRFGGYSVAKIFNELLDAIVYAGVFVFLVIRPFGIQTFYIPSGSMQVTLHENDFIIANKLVYRISEPQHGDIIVFKPPKRALHPGQGDTDFIKRLIGLPGDVVELRNRILYRNGMPVNEPYRNYTRVADPMRAVYEVLTPDEEQQVPIEMKELKLVNFHGEIVPFAGNAQSAENNQVPDFRPSTLASKYHMAEWLVEKELEEAPPTKIPDGFYLMMGDNRNNSLDGRYWGLIPRSWIIGRSEAIWLPLGRWRITR